MSYLLSCCCGMDSALEFAAAEMPTVASDAESCIEQAMQPTAQMTHMTPLTVKKRRVSTFAVARALARQRQAAATDRIPMMSNGSISRNSENGKHHAQLQSVNP